MIQRGEQLRLALEARQPIGIGRERGGQDFDRDVALSLGRGRDRPRPSRPRRAERLDLVCTELTASQHRDARIAHLRRLGLGWLVDELIRGCGCARSDSTSRLNSSSPTPAPARRGARSAPPRAGASRSCTTGLL